MWAAGHIPFIQGLLLGPPLLPRLNRSVSCAYLLSKSPTSNMLQGAYSLIGHIDVGSTVGIGGLNLHANTMIIQFTNENGQDRPGGNLCKSLNCRTSVDGLASLRQSPENSD